MSRKSPLVEQMLGEMKEEIKAIRDNVDMSDADKAIAIKDIESNLYTVGYRYPVPSKYNLGLYKVRIAEDMPGWKHVGPDQVVTNPLATYLKLEGDNDGDHIFFLSAKGNMGNVLGNAVIGKDPKNNLLEYLKTNSFKNDFIIADQDKKVDPTAP